MIRFLVLILEELIRRIRPLDKRGLVFIPVEKD